MGLDELASELTRLRARLAEAGADYPELQRRIEALTRSIEHLQADLAQLRRARPAEAPPGEV